MSETLISIFKETTVVTPAKNANYLKILLAIAEGFWEPHITRVRSVPPEEYSDAKRSLPAVTFSGTFTERSADKLETYSRIMVIDCDHIELSQIRTYKSEFKNDPYIHAAFVSPSNAGLKILFKLDSDQSVHLIAFGAIKKYLEDKYAMSVDKSGKDICRLCYISFDPELYLNEDSLPWHTEIDPSKPMVPSLDGQRFVNVKFSGKKVSKDVEYIFQVAKKWTERSFQCVPGSYNNYVHYLACVCNRCGVLITDTVWLIEQYTIIPDKKWQQSVKSAYFHNKNEFNTIAVYEIEKNMTPIEEEKVYSEDQAENDIIRYAIILLNKGLEIKDIKDIMTGYAYKFALEGLIDLNDVKLSDLLGRAYNKSDLANISAKGLNAILGNEMLGGIIENMGAKSNMTCGFPEYDRIMGGGPNPGCFYCVIGVGGTFKSIFVQNMASENAKIGIPVLYLNGEMSSKQYFERLFNKELKLDFNEEVESGRLNKGNYQEYSNRIDEILGHNLFCVTGSGFSKEEIVNTIQSIQAKTGKRIKMVIADGLTQLEDVKNNEILSAIHNTSVCKEISKEMDIAFIALMHTSGAMGKYHRNTADYVRGGTKTIANMDSYFCTSLLVDASTLDSVNNDIIYQSDKMWLRYIDKRNSGEILNRIIQISRPFKMEVMAYDPLLLEIDMSKGNNKR